MKPNTSQDWLRLDAAQVILQQRLARVGGYLPFGVGAGRRCVRSAFSA
jgi:hypothetical protein